MHFKPPLSILKLKLIQLKRMRLFLNKKAALLIYKNTILPIMEYGNIFLTSLSVATKKKLQIMQNRALRIALSSNHVEAKLLKLGICRKAHMLQFAFRQKSNRKLLIRKRVGCSTRSSSKTLFKLKKPTTEKYKKSLSYNGFKLWSSLPAGIQSLKESVSFKTRIAMLLSPKGWDPEEEETEAETTK